MVFLKKGLNILVEYYIQKCIHSFSCDFHPHISIYMGTYTYNIYREFQICHSDTFLHPHLCAQSNILRGHQNLQLKFHLFYQKGRDFLSFPKAYWIPFLPNKLCFMFLVPEYSRNMPAGLNATFTGAMLSQADQCLYCTTLGETSKLWLTKNFG